VSDLKTLRGLSGLSPEPASLKKAALILIDIQNTYRDGVLRIASATATRDLPAPDGSVVPAAQLQAASLAALGDLFAVVARDVDAVRH